MELDNRNKWKGKNSPKKDTQSWGPLVHTLWNPTETLNWKPYYIHKGYSSCLLFCRVPWCWGERNGEDIPFRAECSQVSHSLHNVWLSLFAPICCRRKLLWWWLNKALICEYSRMLRVFFIRRTVGIWVSPWSLTYLDSGSWSPKQCEKWVPPCWVGIRLHGTSMVTPTSFVPPLA